MDRDSDTFATRSEPAERPLIDAAWEQFESLAAGRKSVATNIRHSFAVPGYRPEIYSMGHRNQLGLTIHPVTGALWSAEHGPNGGDELNIILPGRNYGWPDVSLGRDYEGPWQGKFEKDGIERPIVYWMPSIAVSDLLVYTGDKFPQWRGNVLVGSMRYGEIPNTGHMQRIVFNANGDEIRREMMLTDLRQRIRAVKQAPDGTIYLLTEEAQGALLRIEPQ